MGNFATIACWRGTIFAVLLAATCTAANAQDFTPLSNLPSVTGRPRPLYDPLGFRLANWAILPRLSIDEGYDSNIYNTEHPRDDFITTIRPDVVVRSDSTYYSANVNVGADIYRYLDTSSENTNKYHIDANGFFDISRDTRLGAQLGYDHLTEPRGSAGDTSIGGKPIIYNLAQGKFSLKQLFGNLELEFNAGLSQYAYDNENINGTVTSQSFRDLIQYSEGARVSYALTPAFGLYIAPSFGQAVYRESGSIDRNSQTYSVIGGVQFPVTRLLTGRIGVGYIIVDFADSSLSDVSGLDYDLALTWSPTQRLTVALTGTRSLERSPIADLGGLIQSQVHLKADYELLRNLILSGNVDYSLESFQGEDTNNGRWSGGVSARYLANRLLTFNVSAKAREQNSTSPFGREYSGYSVMVGCTLHF